MEEGNIEEVLVDKELMHIIFCFLPTLGDLRSAAAVCRFRPNVTFMAQEDEEEEPHQPLVVVVVVTDIFFFFMWGE